MVVHWESPTLSVDTRRAAEVATSRSPSPGWNWSVARKAAGKPVVMEVHCGPPHPLQPEDPEAAGAAGQEGPAEAALAPEEAVEELDASIDEPLVAWLVLPASVGAGFIVPEGRGHPATPAKATRTSRRMLRSTVPMGVSPQRAHLRARPARAGQGLLERGGNPRGRNPDERKRPTRCRTARSPLQRRRASVANTARPQPSVNVGTLLPCSRERRRVRGLQLRSKELWNGHQGRARTEFLQPTRGRVSLPKTVFHQRQPHGSLRPVLVAG